MSFYKRYELARLVQEGDAKTFRAVEIATGRDVLLHLLVPSAALSAVAIREIVARAEHQPGVIEVGEFAGSFYIATEPSESFQSFRQWVDSLAPAPPGNKASPPAKKRPEVRKLTVKHSRPAEPPLGGFTEVFGVPKAKLAGKEESSEFTKLFYGAALPKPATAIPELPSDPTGTAGEFTKFFSGNDRSADEFKPVFDAPLSEPEDAPPVAAASPPPLWPELPERDDRTGEYTKFFGNSLPGDPVDIPAEQAKQAGLSEPTEKPFRQASDFTRMFGPEGPGAKPAPTVSSNRAISEGTMNFGPASPEAPETPRNVFFTPADDFPAEPDDYARVVGPAGNPGQMSGFTGPSLEPPGHDKKRTGLIIVVVLVGVTLLSLLIWAVMSRGAR